MAKVGFRLDYKIKLNQVKRCFPDLDFTYEQQRGSKTKSFVHEAWVLYNLIEVYKPKEVYGFSGVIENSVGWEKRYFFPRRFYRWGISGKQGPEKVIESVIPGIKLVTDDDNIIFIGYQNSFFGFRPDFSIYLGFKDNIRLASSENKVDILFDDEILTSIIKKEYSLGGILTKDDKYSEWQIENYNFAPNIIVEAKESKHALNSTIRGNIKTYRQMFPNTKIVVVCPEKIDETKLNGCFFVLDTYDKKLLERKECDKNKFQERLRQIVV